MIISKEAYKIFKKAHPDLTVVEAALYDNKYYMFVALKDPNVPEFNDPYYAIDKNTGELYNFTPTRNLEKFYKAFREHPIDVRSLK